MHELTRFSALEMAALWRGNRRRLAEDHLRGRAQASGRPSHLKIELTNFCNLACPLCPHPQMRREIGYMRPELFRRIIDEAAPELEFAYLHHLGESLFHARLGELIRYGRSRGAAMGLSTNATFLDAKKSRMLLDSGLDFLVISVDGATPATYERMRVGADFATTVANVRALFAQKRTVPNHTAVVVQMIVTPLNRHEIDDFAAQWEGDGAQVMIKEARDWAGQVRLERPAAPPPPVAGPCKLPWTELTILWDGAVVPCANFTERTHAVGDLASQSLDEIWNGPALAQLRAAHAANAVAPIPVCAGCPRQPFDHADFVALDQLALRRRTYLRPTGDHAPRPGLS